MTQKQRSSTQKHGAIPGWKRGGTVFAAVCVLCSCLASVGAAADPSPAAVSSKSFAAGKAADAGPRRLFTDHGLFEGTVTRQPGGNVLSTPEKRTHPVSLPAGTYRILLDVRALTTPTDPSQPLGGAFLRLPVPGVNPGQVPSVRGLSLAAPAERFGGVITLTAPFQGDVEYGAGTFGRQEAWFTIVPAQDPGFVPFGFGGVPEALPRGAAHAARKTLTAEAAGDVYFLRLPAGSSRVSLEAAAAVGTPVPAGASSGGREGGFGVAVDRLDQWGVTTQETFLVARFGRGEFGRQQSRQVITAARPEFIKLRVRPLGVLPVPAPRYVLTVGAADGK